MTPLTLKEHEVGKTSYQKGCFTQLKWIAGPSLQELEIRLGFRYGRLSQGAYVLQACELPTADQFDLIGYTNTPTDQLKTENKYDKNKVDARFGKHDHDVLKKGTVIPSWSISGPDSLVKIIPVIPHSDLETYPFSPNPIPQWLLNTELRCTVLSFVPPGHHFSLFKRYV